jgi:hypothetical protein
VLTQKSKPEGNLEQLSPCLDAMKFNDSNREQQAFSGNLARISGVN